MIRSNLNFFLAEKGGSKMGFRISVSDETHNLLQRLESDPGAVFPRPYKGYLLFLAGAADQPALNWLAENLVALDSLTGDDIAFGVFAKEYSFKVGAEAGQRPSRNLGKIEASQLDNGAWSVERIVKSGRFGWVVDGDEVAAVTYATDDIARGFGVLGRLPCVIALDCLPLERFLVIDLAEQVRSEFFPMLRRALVKFAAQPGFSTLEAEVERIVEPLKALENLESRKASLQRRLQHEEEILRSLTKGQDRDFIIQEITERVARARKALVCGSMKNFRAVLTGSDKTHLESSNIRHKLPLLILNKTFITILKKVIWKQNVFYALDKTIKSLEKYNSPSIWPLDNELRERYSVICSKYVLRMIGKEVSIDDNSHHGCGKMIRILKKRQESEIELMISKMPYPNKVREIVIRKLKNHFDKPILLCEARIRRLKIFVGRIPEDVDKNVELLERRIERQLKIYAEASLPLFTSHLRSELTAMRLGSYGDIASSSLEEYVKFLIKPEMVFRILRTLSG
jgi:hypothetical protein